MDLIQLRAKAVKSGVPTAIIEKEYVLSIVLVQLAETSLKKKLIFKGGTAIKKTYFQNARFSEDLDFTAGNISPSEIADELKIIFEKKETNDIQFSRIEREKTSAGLKLSLKFMGLLKHPQRIRFDFSFRQNSVLPPIEKPVFDDYALGSASINVMQLEEVFAEKIHALFTRAAARDLYDAWFLFNNNVVLRQDLVDKKFSYYKEKYLLKNLSNRLYLFQPTWQQDLNQFIPAVPDFDSTSKKVLEKLETELK